VAKTTDLLPIGVIARRAGVAPSALRFYEAQGLIWSTRNTGNQRRFERGMLRRIAFIRTAQRVGLTLDEIRAALDSLPSNRTPNKADWERLSRLWRRRLDERIAELERLRDKLTSCIGCGCLSLRRCALSNTDDELAAVGPGAHYLIGDVEPDDAAS
jgi:MerR family transcriptional regulator, redox-sensitive transcriptional activator SoxR